MKSKLHLYWTDIDQSMFYNLLHYFISFIYYSTFFEQKDNEFYYLLNYNYKKVIIIIKCYIKIKIKLKNHYI